MKGHDIIFHKFVRPFLASDDWTTWFRASMFEVGEGYDDWPTGALHHKGQKVNS